MLIGVSRCGDFETDRTYARYTSLVRLYFNTDKGQVEFDIYKQIYIKRLSITNKYYSLDKLPGWIISFV